jgi:cytoskeletal protein RodZ
MSGPRTESIGAFLRRTREGRNMSVAEVSRATRIPTSAIERIEADHFDDLPGEVFARGFLKAYASAVRVAPDEVLARYTAARRIVSVEPLPTATPVARSGSRRFGVAIALVLLLVLFTLALSIVMRPRGHDRPQELSDLGAASDVSAPSDKAAVSLVSLGESA